MPKCCLYKSANADPPVSCLVYHISWIDHLDQINLGQHIKHIAVSVFALGVPKTISLVKKKKEKEERKENTHCAFKSV